MTDESMRLPVGDGMRARAFPTPEIINLGGAAELTEGDKRLLTDDPNTWSCRNDPPLY
jgi:hypothetical protein